MGEEPNIYPNLSDQQQFSLNKMNEVKEDFIEKISKRELLSKKFSNYIASFDCFDKSFIVLSATNGSIFIVSCATVIGHL